MTRSVMTCDEFTMSAMESTTRPLSEVRVFDEKSLIRLENQHQDREYWVKKKLRRSYGGRHSSSSSSESLSNSSKLQFKPKTRVRILRDQIEAIQKERKKILSEGIIRVQEIMTQLKIENEQYSQELEKCENDTTDIDAEFENKVNEIRMQYESQKKSFDEVLSQVRSTITSNSNIQNGNSLSSIKSDELGSMV